jgi:hypothetical protein
MSVLITRRAGAVVTTLGPGSAGANCGVRT